MARAFVTATLCVLGCAGSAGPAASNGGALGPSSSAPSAPPSPPPASAPPVAFTESLAPSEGGTAFAVRSPANGANLPPGAARDTALELEVDAALLPSVELSLDGARSRPVAILPDRPKLSDLGELAPGDHYLIAALRSAPDLPARFSVVRFGVGTNPSKAPLVFCSRPEGTVYAPPDAKLLLDFVTDGFRPGEDGSVRVQILDPSKGSVRFESLLTTSAPGRFTIPGSSDFAMEFTLLDPSGQPLKGSFARDRCEVTRNEVTP